MMMPKIKIQKVYKLSNRIQNIYVNTDKDCLLIIKKFNDRKLLRR